MGDDLTSDRVVWRPDAELVNSSNIAKFMERAGIARHGVDGYGDLTGKAFDDPEWFWNQVIKQFEIRFFRSFTQVLDTSKGIEHPIWCAGATTNAVLNCLDKHRGTATWTKPAILWEGEDGKKKQWTYSKLDEQTCRLAEGLRALGCGKGDAVGVYMPNIPEAAVAILAIAKIGGIIVPLFSGFGAQAVATRLNDACAMAVIVADGSWRRGKSVAMKDVLDEALDSVPAVRHVIVHANTRAPVSWASGRDHWWHELCQGRPNSSKTEEMPADAPMMVIHTSGTTGRPKGTVHTHCGFITKLALDLGLCIDWKPSDRILWMSDMGWIVGPMQIIAGTLLSATIVLAEGAPDYPDDGRYWRLIQDNAVSVLGIAPTIVRNYMRKGGSGIEKFDLSSLRVTVSTGEAWTPDAWNWMFEKVCGRRVPILNYSGGTEIGGAILSGTVLHPLKPCAFGGPIPGMGAGIVDEHGNAVCRGGVGELVLRRPSIGLTRGLWHDPERYIESYWSVLPGLWHHGDRAAIDSDGFWYILGRSDDTLKIAGKRTGPAEVEALVMATGRVAEVVAIGVPDPLKGESAILVATPLSEADAGEDLAAKLSEAVTQGLGNAFRPSAVVFVQDLPKTRNMKLMRRVVRAIYQEEQLGDLSSLVNPECIEKIATVMRETRQIARNQTANQGERP